LTETIEQIAQDDKSFTRAQDRFTESASAAGSPRSWTRVKKEGRAAPARLETLEDAQTAAGARAQLKEALRLYFRRVMASRNATPSSRNAARSSS